MRTPEVYGLRWLALVLAVAAANYVSGRLGLLLALPPGFATAIWPPSGIALGAVLLLGYRLWPGVWLGSFALNIFIASRAGPIEDWVGAATVAGSIALGSSVQAIAGAWLIRRYVGFPNPLLFERQIALFLALGGPVSCMIAASVGIATLVGHGLMPLAVAPFQWWTWWIGDTIGVLTLTPLLLIALAEPRAIWRTRRWPVGVPLTLAFLVAVGFFVYASRAEQARIEASVQRQNEVLADGVRHQLERKLDVLNGIAGAFDARASVSRAEFRALTQRVYARLSGARAIEWIPRVPHAEREAFERAARHDGFGNFSITERVAGVSRPAEPRDEYFPVYYVEPLAGNEPVLGYDLGSESSRLTMLLRAAESGAPAASEPIVLVQEFGSGHGVIVALPLYRAGTDPRRQRLSGFLLLVLDARELVTDALRNAPPASVIVALDDASAPTGRRVLLEPQRADGSLDPADARVPEGAWQSVAIEFAGRHWQLRLAPTTSAAAAQRSLLAWAVLVGGLLFTGLLGAFLLAVTGRTLHVQGLIQELTRAELAQRELNVSLEHQVRETRQALEQLRDAQKQLVQSEKLASLGALVAGISHEINTPLGTSVSAASTLQEHSARISAEHEAGKLTRSSLKHFVGLAQESSAIVLRNLQRAAELIRSFKAVAVDQSSDERRRFGLKAYIDEVLLSLRPHLRRVRSAVEVDCPEDLELDSYPGAIAQILTNFVTNSLLHAFEDAAQGHIRIAARAEQGAVTLQYSDDGKGIAPEYLTRVFDPFFTTKRGAGGSGLGLHIVFNLVTQRLGGTIEADSTVGQGARFTLRFPAVAAESQPADVPGGASG